MGRGGGSESEGTVGVESEQRPQLSSIDQCCQLFQQKNAVLTGECRRKQTKHYVAKVS